MLPEQSPTRPRVFTNPLLETFTRINPRIAFATYPVLVVFIFLAGIFYFNISVLAAVLFFFIGLTFWTLFEYVVHRFVFHVEGGERTQRFQFVVHGVHHEDPKDETRLIMPPLPYMLLVGLLFLLFLPLMGRYTMAFMPGLMLGHLGYVYIHYRIHLPNPPKYLRKNLKHHNLHHFKHHDRCFGVSTTFWDYVFGTMPPKKG